MTAELAPVRWSLLKHIGRSPAHYKHARDAGVAETGPKRLGAAVHSLVFGTEPFLVFAGSSRRTKEWQTFARENAGRLILLKDEAHTAAAIAASVMSTPHAIDRLLEGALEQPIEWEISGRACRGRPDVVNVDLVELKSGYDINPRRWYWECLKLGYIGQLGWYYDGLIAAGRTPPRVACIVAVESKPPYPVCVWDLDPDLLDTGRKQARLYFERLLVCESADEWPGYTQGPQVLRAPDAMNDNVALDFEGVDTEEAAQ